MKRYLFLSFCIAIVLLLPQQADAGCCALFGGGAGAGYICNVVDEAGAVNEDIGTFVCDLHKEGYIDINGNDAFDEGEFLVLEGWDVVEQEIPETLVGAFTHPHIGNNDYPDAECSFFSFKDLEAVQYSDADPVCQSGLEKFSSIDDEEKQLLFGLADAVESKLEASLSNTCCIPMSKSLGLSCAAAGINNSFLTPMKGWIQDGFKSQFNFFSIADWWTCVPSGYEALGSKNGNPGSDYFSSTLTGSSSDYYLMTNACTDVIGAVLPADVVAEIEANPNKTPGIKITTSYWCSQNDASFVKHCACNIDKTQCLDQAFGELEDCENALAGLGPSFISCTKLSPIDDFTKDIKSCSELVVSSIEKNKDFFLPSAKSLEKTSAGNVETIIGRVIGFLVALLGSLSVAIIVYGGAVILTSAGNPERKKLGYAILAWGAIGTIVILSSYAIVQFLFSAFA